MENVINDNFKQEMKERRKSRLRQSLKVFFGRGLIIKISVALIFLFIFVAIFAPLLTKYEPTQQDLTNRFAKPFESSEHILGTDRYGRDTLTRLMFGARTSFQTSFLASIWASIVGSTLGLVAGYFGGVAEKIIMRYVDAQLSIPGLILSMTLAAILGQNIVAIAIVIGIGSIPGYARIAYGSVLSLKENDFIVASRLLGQSRFKIVFKHLLPNCFAALIVVFTMSLGTVIMIESALAYLGVGLAEPTAAWGIMVSDGFGYLTTYPFMALIPGILIILVVVSFNVVGDGLRDALDPRLRGKL